MIFSITRTLALWEYYHAPMTIVYRLESQELPRLLNATGYIHLPPPNDIPDNHHDRDNEEEPRIDFAPLQKMDVTLCVGKEWHRFPGHYLVPDGVRVQWIKSEFDGMLPGHYAETAIDGGLFERMKGTTAVPKGLNDLNKEAPEFYVSGCAVWMSRDLLLIYFDCQVDVSSCDYLIDLDFPLHPVSSKAEPRYAADQTTWERVTCQKFLDARHSSLLTRALWMPGSLWQQQNEFGEYCLLRHRENVARKEREFAVRQNV